ncbi:exonuclease domain-containing protein, partial [Haematococcus lacustris]
MLAGGEQQEHAVLDARWGGQCHCGVPAALRVTKKPGVNNGRSFYSCGRVTKKPGVNNGRSFYSCGSACCPVLGRLGSAASPDAAAGARPCSISVAMDLVVGPEAAKITFLPKPTFGYAYAPLQ